MNATLIVPILLGVIGLFFLVSIVYTLLSPFLGPLGDLRARFTLSSRTKTLSQLDRMFQDGREDLALPLIESAFIFDVDPRSSGSLNNLIEYNQGLFSRLARIVDIKSLEIDNLELLATLLELRGEILKARLVTAQDRSSFFERRSSKGKKTPGWAVNEVNKRLHDIDQKLDINRKTIETQLREIVRLITVSHSPEEIVYH